MRTTLAWMIIAAICLAAVGPLAAADEKAPAPEKDTAAAPAESSPKLRDKEPPETDWVKKSKHPVSWLKWGADLRLREIWADNIITLNKESPGHERHFQRYRGRMWSTVTPVENFDVNFRIVYEPRHICKPDEGSDWIYNEAIIDKLNVAWSKVLGLPLKVVLGRQDIIHGNGWLVLDGTPLDGSRTIFFDGFRAIWDIEEAKTQIDVAYVETRHDSHDFIEPFGDDERPLNEDDSHGVMLFVTNKSIEDTELQGFFIWKNDNPDFDDEKKGRFPPVWSQDADLYTYGGRIVRTFDEHWKARAEFANQTGQKNGQNVCAWGFNSRLDWFAKDALDNNIRVGYEYLSGDDPSTGNREDFDPLWARWPQWSELYIYTYARETRIAHVTNLHRLNVGWTFKPVKKIELCTDYHLLFADENPNGGSDNGFSRTGCFRGQLATFLMKYKFNEHVSGHALAEAFFPGNYYDETMNDPALFLRYEIIFSW